VVILVSKDQSSGGQKGSQNGYKSGYARIDWSVGREERQEALAAAQAKKDARIPSRSHKAFEEFVSPVDKTVISDRGQLARHNKRNGVTNISDYGPDYHARRGKEMHKQRQGKNDKQERYQAIRKSMHKYGLE
jgi:hypothetical protein